MAKERESKSTREKAAAARAEQMAAEQRRERTVRIVGAIGVIVVVALIIGLAVIVPRLSGDNNDSGNLPGPDPAAPVPTGVYGSDGAYPYGVPFGSATAPVLQLWEDFQCPACGALEATNGSGIESLAEAGDMQLVWRPTAFLDNNLGNTASAQAINAWGCAIDAGKTAEYHNAIFANQPETEGDGWTTEQFVSLAEGVGITGTPLTEFNDCLTSGRYLPWAANSTQEFYNANIQGTPTGILDDSVVETATLADQTALEQLVKGATAP